MKTALYIIRVIELWWGPAALGAWILWVIYGIVAPVIGLPAIKFIVFWGITILLKAIFGTKVTVRRD